MRISTFIYLFLVVGALLSAAPMALGAREVASFVVGYGVVLLGSVAVLLARRRPRRSE